METDKTCPTSTALQEDFAKKKLERDQEIQEIQEMLNEISKSPEKTKTVGTSQSTRTNVPEKKTEMETKGLKMEMPAINTLRRSNTDLQAQIQNKQNETTRGGRTSRMDTARSFNGVGESKPRSKSAQLPVSNRPTPRQDCKKTYNPEEARRFMEEQKKKRKSAATAANQPEAKTKQEKEDIKRRLEDLSKNTRKLVSKNLEKKKQNNTSSKTVKAIELVSNKITTNKQKIANIKEATTLPEKLKEFESVRQTNNENAEFKGSSLQIQKPMQYCSKVSVRNALAKEFTEFPEKRKEMGSEKQTNNENKSSGSTLQMQNATQSLSKECVRNANTKRLKEDETKSLESQQTLARTALPNLPLAENHKRIGLLRKTEDEKDYSFSALNILPKGKENLGLVSLTNRLTIQSEMKMQEKSKEAPIVNDNMEITSANADKSDVKKSSSEEEISDLEVPSKTLQSNVDKHKRNANPGHSNLHKVNDLPYLLRPSAAQIYPYSFIMAVRRKLEAISQPPLGASNKNERLQKTSKCTSTADLLKEESSFESAEQYKKRKSLDSLEQQTRKKSKSAELAQRALINDNEKSPKACEDYTKQTIEKDKSLGENQRKLFSVSLESLKSPQTFVMNKQELHAKNINAAAQITNTFTKSLQNSQELLLDCNDIPQKVSDAYNKSKFKSMESIASSFSSMSLPMPISNTLTEVSSIRTESRRNYEQSAGKQIFLNTEDEVSSHIFSSPEKRFNSKQSHDFEFVKPRPVSPLSLEKVEKLKIKSKQTKVVNHKTENTPPNDAYTETQFNQLLEDFNRSLSQVIEVNEQLKSSLDKSQRILSPRSSNRAATSETEKQYTSDFENSPLPSRVKDKLQQHLESTNENMKQRRKQLFEIVDKVKPLLTPPKVSVNLNEHTATRLDLNLKLATNSSARTTSSVNTFEMEDTAADSSVNNNAAIKQPSTIYYEKRLNMIEQLKDNFKQSILESQEKRQNFKTNDNNKPRREIESNNSNRSNMSIYTMEDGNGIESLKEIKPKGEEQINSNTILVKLEPNIDCPQKEDKTNYNDCVDKEDFIRRYTNSLKKQNSNENSMIFKAHENAGKPKENRENVEEFNTSTATISAAKQSDRYDSTISQSPTKAYFNLTHNNRIATKSSELEVNTPSTNSNNTQTSTQRTHSINSIQKSPTKRTNSETTKEMESDTALTSASQSDVESLIATTNNTNKTNESNQKTKNYPQSSILEDLQNTFETASQDNENIPIQKLSQASHDILKKATTSKSDNSAFIKSHVNSSRGDFSDISKEATFNETQFQLAIRSSQLSSTEFAQSADDEVTSSCRSLAKTHAPNNMPSCSGVLKSKHHKVNSYVTMSPSKTSRRISIGTEIVKFFHRYDNERKTQNNDSMSESSLNYSNVGLYDKLIQNEMNKTQHLTALLKMREKALLDRTKGQIAWLEVQKARYKAKGLVNNIAAIKKKQRGILLKMEKEREEIKRLLQTTGNNEKNIDTASAIGHTSHYHTPTKHRKEKTQQPSTAPALLVPPLTRPPSKSNKQQLATDTKLEQPQSAPTILRATYELESSQALEELLKKREEDLRKRRQHVEHLMKWHQRLDEEEAEVLQLERQVLNYNNVPQHLLAQTNKQQPQCQQMPKLQTFTADEDDELTAEEATNINDTYSSTIKTPEKRRASRARKMEKRLKEIDKSLKELSHISASSAANSAIVMGQQSDDIDVSSAGTQDVEFVRTTGLKLNKLWKRLTSQTLEKYEPTRRYKLCKTDLERLYEDAKMAVLRDFAQDEERIAHELLEKSSTNLSLSVSPTTVTQTTPPFANANDMHLQKVEAVVNMNDDMHGNEGDEGKITTLEIPVLNLNFSSGHSEPEEEPASNVKKPTTPQGNYSPSVAEENFKAQLLNLSASSSSCSAEEQLQCREEQQQQHQQQRIENNVQMFLALTQRLHLGTSANSQQRQGLQRSSSDTQIAEIPKYSAAATSHRNISANASQNNGPSSMQQQQQQTLPSIHQRSKSSIVEITNIPSATEIEKPTSPPCYLNQSSMDTTLAHDRPSVINSIGRVSPIAGIAAPEEATNVSKDLPQRLTYSDQQIEYDSEARAKEISLKLDEITAAVTQLSHANALPSYPLATSANSKPIALDINEEPASINEESNLSTDASSYSTNFANISTDMHSSPGSQQANTSSYSRTKTPTADTGSSKSITSTSIKTATITESLTNSNLGTFIVTTPPNNSANSKTFSKDSSISKTFVKNSPPAKGAVSPSQLDKPISEDYEPDFETDTSDETHIEDITLPLYETTNDTTNEGGESADVSQTSKIVSDKTYCAESTTTVIGSNEEFEKTFTTRTTITITSPEREMLPPPPLPPPPPPLPVPSSSSATSHLLVATVAQTNGTNNGQLMPDIINELELRRHQLILDNEHLKQYEHVTAVPYMYVREIPNKPPPPYVPPAHGSPMTTIFPSEERIKDITYRRTHELYCELLKTEYCNEKGEKLPSVMEEQITNIYERIILDICREYLEEHSEILRDGDPTNFHSQLSFFNPPNRLRCIQGAVYKEVRLCLAMDKTQPKRTQVYSVYGQRAKQDHIGKIIIQEMYDEDDRWCNFHREESEVLHLIVEEILNKNIRDLAKEVLLEEGGTIEEDDGIEIEELDDTETNDNLENAREEEQFTAQTLQQTTVLADIEKQKDQAKHKVALADSLATETESLKENNLTTTATSSSQHSE